MPAIIIDTTHDTSFIVLSQDNHVIDSSKLEGHKSLSVYLMPSLDEILKKNNVKISDLSYVAACIGPGSYTGIRVAVSIAQTISYAKKIPLLGFSSLYTYVPETDGNFLSVLDAKTSGFYYLQGSKNNTAVKYTADPNVISENSLIELLKSIPFIVSPDIETIKARLSEKIDISNIFFISPPNLEKKLAFYTYEKFNKKNYEKSEKLKLLYLRGPKLVEK